MFVCFGGNQFLVKTNFNKDYYLTHKFINVKEEVGDLSFNCPVDFKESGLVKKDSPDIFNTDIVFSVTNDEAVPPFINGTPIGANHGQPCAIQVYSEKHQKTIKDVGAVYKDESGIEFTLLKVLDDDLLVFVSQNVGEDDLNYKFIKKIEGKLNYCRNGNNKKSILINSQSVTQLYRAIKRKKCEVIAYTNQDSKRVVTGAECDYVDIIEEYDIINPATVCSLVEKNRPIGGYKYPLNLSNFGEPMFEYKIVYRIDESGEIVIYFNHKKIKDVDCNRMMGVMYQEKKDMYLGGVYRIIPKTLPFTESDITFDFSKPVALRGEPFPRSFALVKEFWQDKNSPPDRVIDYFKDVFGNVKLGFACGFLPIYDGEPNVRKDNIDDAINIKFTHKVYPTFKDKNLDTCKGVGYKKYFEVSKNGISCYDVKYLDKNYIYMDFLIEGDCEYKLKGEVKPFEISENVEYSIKNGVLTVKNKSNSSAYATFIEQL